MSEEKLGASLLLLLATFPFWFLAAWAVSMIFEYSDEELEELYYS